jgi:hypothetical protein
LTKEERSNNHQEGGAIEAGPGNGHGLWQKRASLHRVTHAVAETLMPVLASAALLTALAG